MIAKGTITGNIGNDPIVKEIGDKGNKVLELRVAVPQMGGRDSQWFDVRAYNGRAEAIATRTAKGNRIQVHGDLQVDSWTDGNGAKHSRVWLTVTDFNLIDRLPKPDGEQPSGE